MAATLLSALMDSRKEDEKPRVTCSRCNVSFSQLETLKRHLTYYCGKTNGAAITHPTTSARLVNPALVVTTSTNPTASTTSTGLAEKLAALLQKQGLQAAASHLVQPPTQSASTLLDLSGMSGLSNTIILPVGFHQSADPNVIQLVGPPQTVIPVAISRSLPVSTRPLLLDGSLMSQLQLPSRLIVNPAANEFGLPLAFVQPWPFVTNQTGGSGVGVSTNSGAVNPGMSPLIVSSPLTSVATQKAAQLVAAAVAARQPPTATATVTASTALSPSIISGGAKKRRARTSSSSSCSKRKCDSVDSRPLDLSSTRPDSHRTSPSEVIDNEKRPSKPHGCECGVSFLSAETLRSHRRYYCRNRVIDEAEEHESPRKVPARCSQCDYVPVTNAQLAQHIRHKHCLVQAFVCLLCGYKGYSPRGIKNHLRTAHIEEMQRRRTKNSAVLLSDRSLLEDYVYCVTADTKQLGCSRCRSTFPTTDLLRRHQCPKRARDESDGNRPFKSGAQSPLIHVVEKSSDCEMMKNGTLAAVETELSSDVVRVDENGPNSIQIEKGVEPKIEVT